MKGETEKIIELFLNKNCYAENHDVKKDKGL